MRTTRAALVAALLPVLSMSLPLPAVAVPVGTAFTYQGRLDSSGVPVTGTCSMRFSLYDAAAGGGQVGSTLVHDGQGVNPPQIAVANGLFTASLDFGTGVFTGDARWLLVELKCGADPGYTSLTRQQVTPAPYALTTTGLQGRAVSATAPTSGQVLQWAGSEWAPATPADAGLFDNGCPGPRVRGVCLLAWNNLQQTGFYQAAQTCASGGGDLCTDSQAWQLGVATWQNPYLQEAVLSNARWTASFADNDQSYWNGSNGGTGDDHSANSSYGYACCGGTTPVNPRVPVSVYNYVRTTYVHNVADMYWSGAVGTCAALNSDLCSDAQTLLLRDASRLTVPAWTSAHSDNDSSIYTDIVGAGVDDPHPGGNLYGFACCSTLRPSDLSCPVARISGVCAPLVHDTPDANFRAAAGACAAAGYDLCSTAQNVVLRTVGALTVVSWTNSHSDNDGGQVSGAVGSMPDNPPLTMLAGYACCSR